MKFHLYEGIRIDDNGQVVFNWDKDDNRDIIYLDSDTSGKFNEEDIRYIYGYKYTPNATASQKSIVRNYIKSGNINEDIEQFVEKAVIKIDEVQRFDSFGTLVSIKPSKFPSILSIIENYLHSYMKPPFLTFELIKQTHDNIIFDRNKAFNALIEIGYDIYTAENEVLFIANKFEKLKQNGELFQIKRFVPTVIRSAFSNFLIFKNEKQRITYEKLQGVNILIYDDFLTSGSTIKEIIRYLKSINSNNKLTVFVLVNQRNNTV